MTTTVPETPRDLDGLACRLMADESVMAVDVCRDCPTDTAPRSTWAEVTITALTVPHLVVDEIARSRGRFELYGVDHRNDHTIVTILEVSR